MRSTFRIVQRHFGTGSHRPVQLKKVHRRFAGIATADFHRLMRIYFCFLDMICPPPLRSASHKIKFCVRAYEVASCDPPARFLFSF